MEAEEKLPPPEDRLLGRASLPLPLPLLLQVLGPCTECCCCRLNCCCCWLPVREPEEEEPLPWAGEVPGVGQGLGLLVAAPTATAPAPEEAERGGSFGRAVRAGAAEACSAVTAAADRGSRAAVPALEGVLFGSALLLPLVRRCQ